MFDWLTRPSGSEEDREGQSDVGDEPETPAPQFAIRALKSTFLGTPYAKQHHNPGQEVVESAHPIQHKATQASQFSLSNIAPSPTKGILVTPGTGVNKRKTVSFGSLIPDDSDDAGRSFTGKPPTTKAAIQQNHDPGSHESASLRTTRQVVMTKSLFEAQLEDSKRRISGKPANNELEGKTIASQPQECNTSSLGQSQTVVHIADATLDLNEPNSTSGKHWKGEYEQYHRKSNRELKRVIQHGQTIKSYAQRKDSEATCLKEKLRNELAKVSKMEARVSELATELAHARAQETPNEVNSVDLVSELAKQTTLAIRYKQKADRYKAALGQREHASGNPEQVDDCIRIPPEESPTTTPSPESRGRLMIRKDLDRLQSAVELAEERSSKLQHENLTLKQKLAHIKQEMRSYETRRLAREEKTKKREARLISVKESCERKLSNLAVEHNELLRLVNVDHKSNLTPRMMNLNNAKESKINGRESMHTSASHTFDEVRGEEDVSKSLVERTTALAFRTKEGGVTGQSDMTGKLRDGRESDRRPSRISKPDQAGSQAATAEDYSGGSPRTTQTTNIDIWTHESPDSLVDDTTFAVETPKTSGFSMLRQETYDALAEIDQNSVPDRQIQSQRSTHGKPQYNPNLASSVREPSPQRAALCSAVRRMHSRRLTIASPRPSLLNFTATSVRPNLSYTQADTSHKMAVRPSRILSAETRTSAMTSKGGRLPPDRAEAARKRLEARKGGEKPPQVDNPKP